MKARCRERAAGTRRNDRGDAQLMLHMPAARKSPLRHPEAPAHHMSLITTCTSVRGPRRMAAAELQLGPMQHDRGRRPSRLARPKEAARAPQGDGDIHVLAATARLVALLKKCA